MLKTKGVAIPQMGQTVSKQKVIHDRHDRRSAIDRRQFSYHLYIPERRSGLDRRSRIRPKDALYG
jgi:hypothetical protein